MAAYYCSLKTSDCMNRATEDSDSIYKVYLGT